MLLDIDALQHHSLGMTSTAFRSVGTSAVLAHASGSLEARAADAILDCQIEILRAHYLEAGENDSTVDIADCDNAVNGDRRFDSTRRIRATFAKLVADILAGECYSRSVREQLASVAKVATSSTVLGSAGVSDVATVKATDIATARENLAIFQAAGNERMTAEWTRKLALAESDAERRAKIDRLYADLTEVDSPQAEVIRRQLHQLGESVYGPVYTPPVPTATWSTCGECLKSVRNGSTVYHARGCSRRRAA